MDGAIAPPAEIQRWLYSANTSDVGNKLITYRCKRVFVGLCIQ